MRSNSRARTADSRTRQSVMLDRLSQAGVITAVAYRLDRAVAFL
jgi:hypothetical protein